MSSIMQSTIEEILSFAGGVNIASAPGQPAEDECLGLNNVILDELGGGSKRRGCTQLKVVDGEIQSIYVYYRGANFPPQIIIQQANGDVDYSDDGGATFSGILSGVDTTNPMSFETFNGNLYMSNGVDDYIKWDGTTQTAIPTAPKGKFLRIWKDTMWVAGTDDDRVWSSDPGNADVFTVGNWVDLAKGDGDSIVGLATDGNVLICPKRRRGFLIYDPTTFANRMYDPDKGAESHFSFVHHAENLYYFTRLGIVIYLGDSPSQIISDKIAPLFQQQVLNFDKTSLVWAYTHNNRIGWSVPEAGLGAPSMQIELLPQSQKKPFTFHRMPARCFATYRVGTTEQLLAGKVGSPRLLECFKGGTDDGTPFVGTIETRWFNFKDPIHWKYLREMTITGRGQFFVGVLRNFETGVQKTLTVDLSAASTKWDEPGDVWDDELWGPLTLLQTSALHPDMYGQSFKFHISDASDEEGVQNIDIGDVDYAIVKGSWAIYGAVLNGVTMGTDL